MALLGLLLSPMKIRNVVIFLAIAATMEALPMDFFRFGITYNDSDTSYQPLYFNVTSDGDFFAKAFGALLTNVSPSTVTVESTLAPDPIHVTQDPTLHVTSDPNLLWDIENNNV